MIRHRGVRALLLCGLVVVSHATVVQAQARSPQAITSRTDINRAADSVSGWHVEQCMAGLTYGAPLKLALAYGGGLLYEPVEGRDVCALVVAKIGLGGVQASAGVGTSFGAVGSGVMLTGNLLRTFGSPLNATPRSTYVGASVHLWPLLALGGEIGYYVRLGSDANAPSSGKRFIGWSAGFGF